MVLLTEYLFLIFPYTVSYTMVAGSIPHGEPIELFPSTTGMVHIIIKDPLPLIEKSSHVVEAVCFPR